MGAAPLPRVAAGLCTRSHSASQSHGSSSGFLQCLLGLLDVQTLTQSCLSPEADQEWPPLPFCLSPSCFCLWTILLLPTGVISSEAMHCWWYVLKNKPFCVLKHRIRGVSLTSAELANRSTGSHQLKGKSHASKDRKSMLTFSRCVCSVLMRIQELPPPTSLKSPGKAARARASF